MASAVAEAGCPFAPRCPEMILACRTAVPPLEAIGPGRAVACIREVEHAATLG